MQPQSLWVSGRLQYKNFNPDDHRYVVSDANSSNGAQSSNVEVNSSGRWKVGIERRNGDKWEPLAINASLKENEGTLSAGGAVLNLYAPPMVDIKMMAWALPLLAVKWLSLICFHSDLLGLVDLSRSVLDSEPLLHRVVKPNTTLERVNPLAKPGQKMPPKVPKPRSIPKMVSGLANGLVVRNQNTSTERVKMLRRPSGSPVMVMDCCLGSQW